MATKILAALTVCAFGFNCGMIFEKWRAWPHHEEMYQLYEAKGALEYKWAAVLAQCSGLDAADKIYERDILHTPTLNVCVATINGTIAEYSGHIFTDFYFTDTIK